MKYYIYMACADEQWLEEFDSREEFEKRIKESKSDGINIEKCIIGYDYVILLDE